MAALYWKREYRLAVHLSLALLGLGGLVLVQQTAERGGQMVYQYGVAVAAVDVENSVDHDPGVSGEDEGADHAHAPGEDQRAMEGMASVPAPLGVHAEGAWSRTSGDGPLPSSAPVLSGAPASGGRFTVEAGRPTLVSLGEPVGDLEAEATLDLSGFTDTVMLVHNLQDARTYDFLALDTSASGAATVRQGRVTDGAETTFDSGTAPRSGTVELKTYAVGTHFRGYAGGDQVTHGHGDAAPPGRVGLRLDGQGTVRVLALSAAPVE